MMASLLATSTLCLFSDVHLSKRVVHFVPKSTIPKAERQRRTAHKKAVKQQNKRNKKR